MLRSAGCSRRGAKSWGVEGPRVSQTQAVKALQAALAAGADREQIRWARAPLRICLLGAHIDHQGGQVLGTAVDRSILLAFAPDPEGRVTLRSGDYPGEVSFSAAEAPRHIDPEWARYAAGAALALSQRGPITRGLRGGVVGEFPPGGLSTSAAVGIAYLLALEHVNGLSCSAAENIELDRVIENDYIGLRNGILDQSMILLSHADCLTAMDCATGQHAHIAPGPLPEFRLAVVHSGIMQSLVRTGYNHRVEECREAARLLLEAAGLPIPDSPRLCDVPEAVYADYAGSLPAELALRAHHYFSENERVRRGKAAWTAGDLESLGALIAESGRSSVENYQCGTPALIDLVALLNRTPGVYGARFSGAGFRGACFALARPDAEEAIAAALREEFAPRYPELAEKYRLDICRPVAGARIQ